MKYHWTVRDSPGRIAYFEEEFGKLSYAIQAKAVEEELSAWDNINLYPKYALPHAPLELVCGENVPRLREIATKYDPHKLMTLPEVSNFRISILN
ncbi:FAD-binding domain-containing protein [Sanghuangporus baumii]|uniref:FAD-binding domain-containing protein n=1 Tax=Sanghuangporus baumii TaxID=108892 RepID=A0A9Q5I147_SANBA|nr:FAD-binding domain-containing protein [Sanghuangporus baumii]